QTMTRSEEAMRSDKTRGSELLTTREAAELLGITEKTLYAWRKRGDIKPIPGNRAKIKEPRYYRRRDIELILSMGRRSMQQLRAS
ncbi:MAG TPA: helix-turn-helix domain-containing protein, partial [Ktedonobacterales bacterium]|nr:helix-turn-helix domain-containing protein [Ktedonobacterales bacterium]